MQVKTQEEIEQENDKSSKNRIISSIAFITCHVAFIIAIIVVLSVDTSSCHYPIRAWLIAYAVLSIVGTVMSLIIEIVIRKKQMRARISSRLYGIFYLLMILFFITWTILGSVWVYKDDNCKNQFELGWKLIVAILAIQYLICIICSFAGCVGVVYALALQHMRKMEEKERAEVKKV